MTPLESKLRTKKTNRFTMNGIDGFWEYVPPDSTYNISMCVKPEQLERSLEFLKDGGVLLLGPGIFPAFDPIPGLMIVGIQTS